MSVKYKLFGIVNWKFKHRMIDVSRLCVSYKFRNYKIGTKIMEYVIDMGIQ